MSQTEQQSEETVKQQGQDDFSLEATIEDRKKRTSKNRMILFCVFLLLSIVGIGVLMYLVYTNRIGSGGNKSDKSQSNNNNNSTPISRTENLKDLKTLAKNSIIKE